MESMGVPTAGGRGTPTTDGRKFLPPAAPPSILFLMVFYLVFRNRDGPMPDADDFDPDRWAMAGELLPGSPASHRPRRSRRTDRFLKGPVPWTWLSSAMALPGKALAVGLMLWLQCGITGQYTVTFCLSRAVAEGISTTTARRAMRALESAGLVSIRRWPGRGLEVTILEKSAQP
jgi:hypothetical protein